MSPPDSYIERRQTVGISKDEEDRQDQRDLHISLLVAGAVKEAVTEAVKEHMPSKEEREFLALAVRRAARREQLQRAIIEKSLTGLVWAGILFIGVVFFEYMIDHGMWKP
jgi:hypothetical protein